MVPHWWPAALDVIWHIYWHLHCTMGDGGICWLIKSQLIHLFWLHVDYFKRWLGQKIRVLSNEVFLDLSDLTELLSMKKSIEIE